MAALRAVTMFMARSTSSGVEFWMELPISELLVWMEELLDQLTKELEAQEKARKK